MAFGHVIRILILILDLQNLFLKKELQFFADEFWIPEERNARQRRH